MARISLRSIAMLAAGLAAAVGPARAEEVKKPAVKHGFYAVYLTPAMTARLHREAVPAIDFANHHANPWTRDVTTVDRVELGALRATKRAVKRYAIARLRIDRWTVPLTRAGGAMDARLTGARGTRLRFGVSHMAPRADVLIPVTTGRVAVSVGAKGQLDAMYETTSYRFRVWASYDVRHRAATFGLSHYF